MKQVRSANTGGGKGMTLLPKNSLLKFFYVGFKGSALYS